MAASMPLPSMSESKHSVYFRCLLAIAVLIWPVGVVGRSSVSDNVVVQWDAAALQGVRDSRLGPPMVARALAIAHTCMFDAWAAYDKKALGTRLGATCGDPRQNAHWPTRMKRSALQPIARLWIFLRSTRQASLIHSWLVWATIRII